MEGIGIEIDVKDQIDLQKSLGKYFFSGAHHRRCFLLVGILKNCCKQSFGGEQAFIKPGVTAGGMKPTHSTEKVRTVNTEWRKGFKLR